MINMKENTKNHIRAISWVLILVLLGVFSFTDFGIGIIKSLLGGIEGRAVFLFYLGSIFALLVFAIEDFFRKPNFILNVGSINESPGGEWRFLHVNVVNLDWPKWFFLFRRNLASNTSAEIIYKEKDTNKKIFSMAGRWSTNLEPITPQLDSSTTPPRFLAIFNQELARYGTVANISPSDDINDLREGKLVVAFKSKDENECYGFNNDNYIPNWDHDRQFRTISHKLERGVYDVEIIIRSGRTVAKKQFILENLGDRLDSMILKNH